MSDIRIIKGGGKRPEDVTGELAERIIELIYEYHGKITVAAAIGVLHIVAKELLEDNE